MKPESPHHYEAPPFLPLHDGENLNIDSLPCPNLRLASVTLVTCLEDLNHHIYIFLK